MNKKIFLVPVLVFTFLLPHATHAAFTFSLTSQNGDGKGFSTTNNYGYIEGNTIGDTISGTYHTIGNDPLQACKDAVVRSGLSDANDTYCVYDGIETTPLAFSICIYTGCGGAPGAPGPATSPVGSWPVNAQDQSYPPSSNYGEDIQVSIYQTPLQQHVLSAMEFALSWQSINNFCDFGSCPYGRQTDPGYKDVCPYAHGGDEGHFSYIDTGPASACTIYHHNGVVATLPVAALTATPSTIVATNSSLLTYSCSNGATTAAIDNGVGSQSPASAGSAPVTPGATTTYTLTCTNSAGSSTATATVTVTPVLVTSCSVSPSSMTTTGTATWTAAPSGGTGSYAYSWTGTDGLSGSAISVGKSYATAGTKSGSVTVTSGTQSVTQACTNSVSVSVAPTPALSCTASPASVTLPGSATYTASGATAPYTWTPSDGVGSYGTGATATRNFTTAGTYGMTVSKAGYTDGVCTPNVTTGAAPICTGSAASITATPNRIRPGQTSTLTYTASGVNTSCVISGPGISQTIPANSCSIPAPTPIVTPALSTQSTYTITCDGLVKSTAIVNVVPNFQEF